MSKFYESVSFRSEEHEMFYRSVSGRTYKIILEINPVKICIARVIITCESSRSTSATTERMIILDRYFVIESCGRIFFKDPIFLEELVIDTKELKVKIYKEYEDSERSRILDKIFEGVTNPDKVKGVSNR